MKAKLIRKQNRSGFTLIELMVVIAIIAAIAGVAYPIVLNQRNAGDRNVAQSNLTNLHKTLMSFSNDYGAYPCDTLAERFLEDEKNNDIDYGPITGNTSNCYLRQLFYLTAVESEENFYAKINGLGRMSRQPDNKIAKGHALEKGECGFAYVMTKSDEEGADVKGSVTAMNAPLLMTSVAGRTPMSGGDVVFDGESFQMYALVLFNDGSVKTKELTSDPSDDRKGRLKDLFPENKKTGVSQADRYVVLPPDL